MIFFHGISGVLLGPYGALGHGKPVSRAGLRENRALARLQAVSVRWTVIRAAILSLVGSILILGLVQQPALAQGNADVRTTPPEVQEFIGLLDNPAVRTWLDQARANDPGKAGAAPPTDAVPAAMMANRLSLVREHLRTIAAALPRFPDEARNVADRLNLEFHERGLFGILVLIAAFVAFGYGSERVFWSATARTRSWITEHPTDTVVERLRMLGMLLGYGLTIVAVFGVGSIGAFLVFDWPPLLKQIVLAYLIAVVIVRLAMVFGHVLLVPGGRSLGDPKRYRVIPMPDVRARFWYRRLSLFIGYFAFGSATVNLLGVVGFSPELRKAAAYVLGLGLLATGLEAVWRRPRGGEQIETAQAGQRGRAALNALLTAYAILLWVLWVAGLTGMFWLAVVAFLLPAAIAVVQAAVAHVIRPAGDAEAPAGPPDVLEVCLERGLRALLIIAAAVWLAHAWQVDIAAMTDRDTLFTRLLRGALTSVVVILLADFLWQVAKAVINRKLAEMDVPAEPGTELAVHQARLRTLLPIFRNIFFVALAVLAGLMALSALGVEIGPLIAGAGVVGVAVGFGAQTLVKDVISGIFYLLDDAFRAGEYIQSRSYKGTVESFSLRSVKLRHHRGPVFTVPFGELGAVENMSRDWVIDKFMIAVSYDTDLEKARKLIKKIGQDLAADPELGKQIIEPLKMQGVEEFGEYGIQIRMKMTTKPGEQFVIRRKALASIKHLFDANGIRFAAPSVHVSGGEDAAPAAAQLVVEKLRQVPTAGE
jgi:moderate conductance mechanosensitive channel